MTDQEDPPPLPEGFSFSPEFQSLYRYERFLGKGAMGAVLLMRQLKMNRLVAVKVVLTDRLTSEETARLEREARALAAINHQNILAIYDVGKDGKTPYLVTEYVDGGSVADRLEKGPPFTLLQTLRIMIQVLSGLKSAHKQKVVHRDLKPGNIFLTADMKVKVGDFGLAKNHQAPADAAPLTMTGTILGTPPYMSPEQCRGHAATQASDIYSLGVMLFEMLTGRRPFPGPNVLQYLLQHTNQPAPSLLEVRPDLPASLDAIIRRAMEKDPGKRHPHAGVFRGELQAAVRQLSLPPDVTHAGDHAHDHTAREEHAHADGGSERVLNARYRLERLIGEGGMGQVWLAWDEELETSVAVKLLPPELWRDPEAQANLKQEAKHSAKLAHDNIVRLMTLQAGSKGDEPSFLVMEYVSGPTLAAELARRKTEDLGPFTPEEALPILEGLAAGLEHAHQKSIIHRDIKPSNVLLQPLADGSFMPKLADFGIAAEASSFRTRATGAMPSGTLAYMSPEQQACQKLDGRSDLYSVAATLYQMLTFAPPFVGGNIAWAIAHAPVPSPENVPPRVSEFLLRALAKGREDRPESPRAFVAEYRASLGMDAGPWASVKIPSYNYTPRPGSVPPGAISAEFTPRTDVPIPDTNHVRGELPPKSPPDTGDAKPVPAPRSRATGVLVGTMILGLVGLGVVQSDRLAGLRSSLWPEPDSSPTVPSVPSESPASASPAKSPPPVATFTPSPPSIASPLPVVRPSPVVTPASPPASPLESPEVIRIRRLRADAEAGDTNAQVALAGLYSVGGDGVPKDDREAAKLFRKAADSGNATAQSSLASMYLTGRGVPQDELLAADWFRKAAAQNDPAAQWNLADLLLKKQVLPRGDESASSLLTRAAEGGDARAQAALGGIFANGRGVPRNDALAFKYYRKAADQGNARGQCGLGFMFERGRGVAASPGEAYKWYKLAADQDDPAAIMSVGLCHRRGVGVTQNEATAITWLKRAAERGQTAADLVLAEIYFNGTQPDHYGEALHWYERAATRGHPDAQYLLAMMLADGLGTKADAKAAATWCEKAQKQGHQDAARWLRAATEGPGSTKGP